MTWYFQVILDIFKISFLREFSQEKILFLLGKIFSHFFPCFYLHLSPCMLSSNNKWLPPFNKQLSDPWGLSSILKTPVVEREADFCKLFFDLHMSVEVCTPDTHKACKFLSLCAEADVNRSPHWWGLSAGALGAAVWRSALPQSQPDLLLTVEEATLSTGKGH